MRAELYLVSADLRDDAADGQLLDREHYVSGGCYRVRDGVVGCGEIAARAVVRVGDVVLRVQDEWGLWLVTDAGWICHPDGWRCLQAHEIAQFRCRSPGCSALALDCTGPLLLCEHCADAVERAEIAAEYDRDLAEARKQYPHACPNCHGTGSVYCGTSYGYPEHDVCECLAAGKCPRCGATVETYEHESCDYERCTCGFDSRINSEPVLPFEPF